MDPPRRCVTGGRFCEWLLRGGRTMFADLTCPMCSARNVVAARFCSRCGHSLAEQSGSGEPGVGRDAAGSLLPPKDRIPPPHPHPLPSPPGFQPFDNAPDLFFQREAAYGGRPLLDTEGLAVVLFNAGYPIHEAVIRLRGRDLARRPILAIERIVPELPRGGSCSLEVASYEMPGPIDELALVLWSCEWRW